LVSLPGTHAAPKRSLDPDIGSSVILAPEGHRLQSPQHCEQKMGMPTVKLTVRRNNLEAFHLYEKMGYQQVDIWSHYYRNGEDGLVLEKHL
jgi:hypothetical protein